LKNTQKHKKTHKNTQKIFYNLLFNKFHKFLIRRIICITFGGLPRSFDLIISVLSGVADFLTKLFSEIPILQFNSQSVSIFFSGFTNGTFNSLCILSSKSLSSDIIWLRFNFF